MPVAESGGIRVHSLRPTMALAMSVSGTVDWTAPSSVDVGVSVSCYHAATSPFQSKKHSGRCGVGLIFQFLREPDVLLSLLKSKHGQKQSNRELYAVQQLQNDNKHIVRGGSSLPTALSWGWPHAAQGPKFKLPLPRNLSPDPWNIQATFHRRQPSGLGVLGFLKR